MGGGAAAADVVAAPVTATAVGPSSGGLAFDVGAGVPTRLDVVSAGSGQGAGAGASHWRAMGGGGPASDRGSKAAKHASGTGAQRARSERRVSFAQAVEVWEVEGNTALERAAARAKSELAQATARHEEGRRQPDGMANAPAEWRAYLTKHNGLARWTVTLMAQTMSVCLMATLKGPRW